MPELAVSLPAMTPIVVVLPAAVRPEEPQDLAAAHRERELTNGLPGAEALAQPLDAQNVGRPGHLARSPIVVGAAAP